MEAKHNRNYQVFQGFPQWNLSQLPKGLFTWRWGPQVGEVIHEGSPHLSCKHDQIKMRDYMDRRATPSKRVTSPTWGPPSPCKQALSNAQWNFY